MFKALVNNELVEATKAAKVKCPHCESGMIAKCGNVKVNHWAPFNFESGFLI